MNSTKRNLYFFFPYRGVGGVPILFLRLANYLSNINSYNIFLIDYVDGYMAKSYNKSKNILLVKYATNEMINFKDNDIVVFQSMPLWGMPSNLNFSKKTKLIYWNLHPYNMFGYASSISKYFKNQFVQKLVTIGFRYFIYFYDKKSVQIFNDKKSIYFMDGENYIKTKELLDVDIANPLYSPLIIDDIDNIKQQYTPNDNILNSIWIGRIGDFKVHILLYTLQQLNKIAKNYKKSIVFTIVGRGEYLDYLQEQTNSLNDIEIKYIDYIDPNDLKEFLIDMDIGFAMGTATLDFAKYGLPTVLLDFAYEEITKDYRFDWLYNTKNFTLGRQITNALCVKNNTSLKDIIVSLEDSYQLLVARTLLF